jgi:hypothetical protein
VSFTCFSVARYEHSSLVCLNVRDEEKSFITLKAGSCEKAPRKGEKDDRFCFKPFLFCAL